MRETYLNLLFQLNGALMPSGEAEGDSSFYMNHFTEVGPGALIPHLNSTLYSYQLISI